MKYLTHILSALLVSMAISSCSHSEIPPKPTLHLNVEDSLALIDLYQKGHGENWLIKWDLADFKTWGGLTGWIDSTTMEVHTTEILINNIVNTGGTISPMIGNMKHLQLISLYGEGFNGQIPRSITNLKDLEVFYLNGTSVQDTLFGELFMLPKLYYVEIGFNKGITGKIPEEIKLLPPSNRDNGGGRCRLIVNSLTGSVPKGVRCALDVHQNYLTYYPFEYITDTSYDWFYIPYAAQNCISGTIPDDILNNLEYLKLLRTATLQQRKGYGYSNKPDNWSDDNFKARNEDPNPIYATRQYGDNSSIAEPAKAFRFITNKKRTRD